MWHWSPGIALRQTNPTLTLSSTNNPGSRYDGKTRVLKAVRPRESTPHGILCPCLRGIGPVSSPGNETDLDDCNLVAC